MSQLLIRLKSKKSLEKDVKNINKANIGVNKVPFIKVNTPKQKEGKHKEENLKIEIVIR